jgi:DNA-binding response OmpR family regulator
MVVPGLMGYLPVEMDLEEQVELLRQQLEALTGSPKELGVLLSLRHGMTERLATILHILVKRSPAVVSRHAFHALFYGGLENGGPDPAIFAIHLSRLRSVLRRLGCPGKIATVWNAGWKADADLVNWVKELYDRNIPQEK